MVDLGSRVKGLKVGKQGEDPGLLGGWSCHLLIESVGREVVGNHPSVVLV